MRATVHVDLRGKVLYNFNQKPESVYKYYGTQ